MTLLTNFAVETYASRAGMFPFLDEARGVTVSGEIGLIKPDRAIYDAPCDTLRPRPASARSSSTTACANVEGARAAGWQADALHRAPADSRRGSGRRTGCRSTRGRARR